MQLDRRFLDGSTSAAPEALALQAGPLSLVYEQGGIRYVRLGQREIVRRVYSAVRDANWGTVPDQIANLETEISNHSFRVQFDVTNREREIDFVWRGTITGEKSGRIVFEVDGVANSTFLKNRIGFCILHPMDVAGTKVEIGHDDGSREQAQFPRYIVAENPFLNVLKLRHVSEPGIEVELTFEGDIFETEDQRNWIDASFKTFCTPLSRPRPVEILAGERVFQRITIQIHSDTKSIPLPSGKRGAGAPRSSEDSEPVTLELALRPVGPLPGLGFSLPTDASPLNPSEIECLRLLKPSHLRCELQFDQDIQPALQRAMQTAAALQTQLDLALYIGADPQRELNELLPLVARLKPPIARWTIFPAKGWSTSRELAEAAIPLLRQHDTRIPIGGGTPANFRELTGERPPVELLDFITWSLTPQIHAFDNASLVETLAAHVATVESVRQFASHKSLVVGPVTFKMQVNPYATGPWPPPTAAGQLPREVDVRQLSLFGAGWTLGSIKYLAESGVPAATYYDLVGWKGLMECETGSALPAHFPSLPGCVFPLYHVFADLAEFSAPKVLPLRSSNPLCIDGLALTSETRTRLLLANSTSHVQSVICPITAKSTRLRFLDQRNAQQAMTDPDAYRHSDEREVTVSAGNLQLELLPYALARVDYSHS